MIVETKKKPIQTDKSSDELDAFLTFRLSNKDLAELKAKAKAEKRSISNYIRLHLCK